jgi:hypothetical protein
MLSDRYESRYRHLGVRCLPDLSSLSRDAPPELRGSFRPRATEAGLTYYPIISEFWDPACSPAARDSRLGSDLRNQGAQMRRSYGPRWRVHGEMGSLLLHPDELIWYERNPTEPFDLDSDPNGELDLATERAAGRLACAAEAHAARVWLADEALEALRALGYVDDPALATPMMDGNEAPNEEEPR